MLMAIFAQLIAYIKFRSLLKKSAINSLDDNNKEDSFEYKGKYYARRKFIDLRVDDLVSSSLSIKQIESMIDDWIKYSRKSKNPSYDAVELEALKAALIKKQR